MLVPFLFIFSSGKNSPSKFGIFSRAEFGIDYWTSKKKKIYKQENKILDEYYEAYCGDRDYKESLRHINRLLKLYEDSLISEDDYARAKRVIAKGIRLDLISYMKAQEDAKATSERIDKMFKEIRDKRIKDREVSTKILKEFNEKMREINRRKNG